MTTSHYQQAQDLAQAGEHQRALDCLNLHLAQNANDGQALNDAGTLLYALGRYDEAVEKLLQAAGRLNGQRGQAIWNLAEVYLAAGQPHKSAELFDELAQLEMLDVSLVNRAASALIDQEDIPLAIETLIRSLTMCPDQHVLLPMLEVLRSKRGRVAFFCENGDDKFMREIFGHVGARFETRYVGAHAGPVEISNALEWCDIAWIEWCTELAVTISQLPKVCRTVIRLHRYEAFRDWPGQVNWEHIDALVLVGNTTILQRLRQSMPLIEQRTRVLQIPNGVDLERFSLVNKPRGKNIAVVGHINYWKSPDRQLLCFHELLRHDDGYRLFFAGRFQDDGVLQCYLENMVRELGLEGRVFFEGHQDDIASWLADKHYIVSASTVEGHPVNVLEGMARGLKPIVHAWPGSRDFFGQEYVFRTAREYTQLILEGSWEPERYHQYVSERYSLQHQLGMVNSLMGDLEKIKFDKSPLRYQPTPTPFTLHCPDQAAMTDEQGTPCLDDPQLVSAAQEFWQVGPSASAPETPMQRLRRQRIVQTVCATSGQDLRILELGVSGPSLAQHLLTVGSVICVTADPEAIEQARSLCPEATLLCQQPWQADLPDASFNVVVSQDVIANYEPQIQRQYLKRAFELLAPGGRLVLTAPNAPVADVLNEILLSAGQAPRQSGGSLNEATLRELLSQAGFQVHRLDSFGPDEAPAGSHLFALAAKAHQTGSKQ